MIYNNENITRILESSYKRENFEELIQLLFKKNLAPVNEEYEVLESEKDHKYIRSYRHLFDYNFELDTIAILEINLQKNSMVKKSRTVQRNFIANILKATGYSAAVVAFYNEDYLQEWRLSFVKLEYILDEEGNFIQDITVPKRSSFLVGEYEPSHTAKKQLASLVMTSEDINIEKLSDTFGVEKVTKEFFDKYKEKYLELNDLLAKNSGFMEIAKERSFTSQEFSKKLLGQTVFLYFLQKKGWMGVPIMPNTLTSIEFERILENCENEKNKNTLSSLYVKSGNEEFKFDKEKALTLDAKDLNDLTFEFKGSKYYKNFGYGDKAFLKNLFLQKKSEENFFEDYLEPLLYEALNTYRGTSNYYPRFNCRIPFLNGGLFEAIENYEWEKLDFNIPNEYFVNSKGTGLFDIFDMFNFTVNESEPVEQEIAIDPEMLGKIFENLLEINNRKDSGSYYTPREIVYFMCQDSIAQYLSNKTGIDSEEFKKFIHFGDLLENSNHQPIISNNIIERALEIDKLLADVKIVDPAVGSGAFALGILTQIVKFRSNLTNLIVYNLDEKDKQQYTINRSVYNLKLDSMQNNIFAVDIDFSAADITKLRLWLSLIVDNEIDTVNPLPNLDCNIKVGNSLIDEFKGIKLFDRKKFRKTTKPNINSSNNDTISGKIQMNLFLEDSIENMLVKLNELQKKLFRTHDKYEKNNLKNRIEELEWAMLEYVILSQSSNINQDFSSLRKSRSKPYFLWERDFSEVFDDNKGFDIVIGNPPYGAKLSVEEKKAIKKWMLDTNNMNTAALFIDFSKNRLLRKDGVLTFIVPKSLLYSDKWRSLVDKLSKKTINLIDVEKAFEKVKLEQVVFLYNSGSKNRANYIAQKFLDNEFKRTLNISTSSINKFDAWICDVTEEEINIVNNLSTKLVKLKDISHTKRGVGIQKFIKDEGDLPVVGGRNIERFAQKGIRGYVNASDFAANSSKLAFMQNVKIMSQDLIGHIQNPEPHIKIKSCIDRMGNVLNLDTVQNTIVHDENYSLEYIVSLLNSDFVNWYTYKFIYCSAIRTMHFDNSYIGKIIIPKISLEEQSIFIKLVKEIESLQNEVTGEIEDIEKYTEINAEINDKVYSLYGLNPEQIELIKRQFRN